jgi:predicted glycosyltransferase
LKFDTFIILQYSNGVGHLTRSSAIAEALSAISHVTIFSGGKAVEGYRAPAGIDFVQLAATRWDLAADPFPVPVEVGSTMTEIERLRSQLLVDCYVRIRPRVVIFEFFPFSPRRFGQTLKHLFDVINGEKHRPVVICSARICPAQPWDTSAEASWTNEQLRANFSCVLHHADSKVFPIASLPLTIQSALSGIPVWQTGFVRRPVTLSDKTSDTKGLLLTVGGGSAPGAKLLKRWIEAARSGPPDLFPLRVVCGPMMDAENRKSLAEEQDDTIEVHDSVENLDELIGAARAVVCMGGYNTLVEALSLRKPILAFPHGEMGDQVFQVNVLHSQGMLLKGSQSQSAREITRLMNKLLRFRPHNPIDFNGAARTAEIIKHLLDAS